MVEKNKQNAVAFYDLMFNQCKAEEAIIKFVGDDYIQHNPHVEDGKQGFIDYFNRLAAEYPGKKVEFKKVIAEGEFVVLHCFQHWPTLVLIFLGLMTRGRLLSIGMFCKRSLLWLRIVIPCFNPGFYQLQ